ncbi:hypothetical protein AB0N09_05160 [Streptomyces erythrochromogenes]|uniref:hypothetical protein n=1 Tax=Streptomyces erythrochromogenes TaxID=285574 RepID=UPI003413A93A
MTTAVSRSHTVTVRIDADSTPAPAAGNPAPAPAMSMDEYQRRTLEELADDVIVCGVAYSRTEWEAAEDGVQRSTSTTDETPAARNRPSTWNGSEAPF